MNLFPSLVGETGEYVVTIFSLFEHVSPGVYIEERDRATVFPG